MDPKRYLELKGKAVVSLMRVGNHFALGVRKYDPDSGAELTPDIERMTRASVEAVLAELEDGASSCKQLLADMDAAE